eukprot:GHRR01022586.1.p1 GENE.GHRR01022586.1~~GHRR01022586.1.p1  ORF type:complete len:124 (+),score=15.74 GHRR01022586.1:220-591(+)
MHRRHWTNSCAYKRVYMHTHRCTEVTSDSWFHQTEIEKPLFSCCTVLPPTSFHPQLTVCNVLFCVMALLQVLEELGDIIDLPSRAAAVGDILASGDDGSFVAAFEGLTLLEGTANNIKEAWRR